MLILAFGISGALYFIFDAMQFGDRVAAQQHVSCKDQLDIITIPLNEFKIQADKNEIWYGGQLYDVSSYTIENGLARVAVYHDKDEEGLVKSLADSFESNDKCASASGPHILKHKVHHPNDGKVLTAPCVLAGGITYSIQHLGPPFFSFSLQVCSAVIKPPPRVS